MKSTVLLWISMLAICIMGVSCQRETESAPSGETYKVSLNIDGDFDVDVNHEPMTKASGTSTDAYGINVYYDKEGNGATDDIYAYGLFDNVADMSITLLSNHKYRVVCNYVRDAKNTLYFGQAFNNTYSGYAYPFQTNSSNSTLLNNMFIIGTGTYFTGFASGNAHRKGIGSPSTTNSEAYARVNRFYGETDGYEPVPNGTINVYLKRVVFGAKFVVTGLKEGSLSVKCGEFYYKYYYNDSEGVECIYTFPNVYNVWKNDTPHVATVAISYNSSRGDLWNLSQSRDIQFKRNVMTTVNIQLNPDLSGASVNLSEEELDEENIINLGINTDGLIDIIVNPEN